MILLYTSVCVSIIDVVLLVLAIFNIAHEVKHRFPGLKLRRSYWATTLSSAVKALVACLCPIFNILIAYILLVDGDEFEEMVVMKVFEKYKEEEKNG